MKARGLSRHGRESECQVQGKISIDLTICTLVYCVPFVGSRGLHSVFDEPIFTSNLQ